MTHRNVENIDRLVESIQTHLMDRGLDSEDLRWGSSVILDKENDWAVFLLYNLSGKIVGYQVYNPDAPKARKGEYKKGDLKYWTYMVRGDHRSTAIGVWGLESYDKSSPHLFIVEGVFDAVKLHRAGQAAIAVLGNAGKSELKQWLDMLPQIKISILDNDDAGKKLSSLGDVFYRVPDPYGDLGDMPQDEVNSWIDGIA